MYTNYCKTLKYEKKRNKKEDVLLWHTLRICFVQGYIV